MNQENYKAIAEIIRVRSVESFGIMFPTHIKDICYRLAGYIQREEEKLKAEEDKVVSPINSESNALEVLYWGIKEGNITKINQSYDALCRLMRINTGGARRITMESYNGQQFLKDSGAH